AFAATAASAAERQLCWERDFTDDVRFDIEVGWATPNPLDPNPTIITPTPDADKLFAALRALESDWKTPSSIWPKSAVQIRIYDRGVLRCQAIYTREQIYAQDKDLNGFLRRPLAVSEYFDLDEALGLD
ncbi:MAG: hypothetical protein AAGK78_08550, partial [Planctomycetota bacterium]